MFCSLPRFAKWGWRKIPGTTTFYLPGELASWTTCYSGNKSQCVMQRRLTWCEMPANNLSHPAHADQSQLTVLPWNLAQGRDHFPLCPIQPWRLWGNHHPWFLRILTHQLGHQLSNCIRIYIYILWIWLYIYMHQTDHIDKHMQKTHPDGRDRWWQHAHQRWSLELPERRCGGVAMKLGGTGVTKLIIYHLYV